MAKRKATDVKSDNCPKKGHWAGGLLQTMNDPDSIVYSDELITVIKDKYPKAEFHYLVLSKEYISNLKKVSKDHLNLLKHMQDKAREIIDKGDCKDKTFNLGYHAEASMDRLHLHVISDDFNSPSLKTKKHWNTFTTDFFLKSENIIKDLEQNGKIHLPPKEKCKQYLDKSLECNKCNYKPKNMPDLKKHIVNHLN